MGHRVAVAALPARARPVSAGCDADAPDDTQPGTPARHGNVGAARGSGNPVANACRDHRHSTPPAAAPAGNRLPDSGMTTQPQPPVTVTPSLPNRRNAELLLLCFATVITTAAFAIVQANQDRGISWQLVDYAAGFLAV